MYNCACVCLLNFYVIKLIIKKDMVIRYGWIRDRQRIHPCQEEMEKECHEEEVRLHWENRL